jgi:hypothetical protein
MFVLFAALHDYFISPEIIHLKGNFDSRNPKEHADL